MCQPTNTPTTPPSSTNESTLNTTRHINSGPINVVVAGAGPSGILMALNILRRNKKSPNSSTSPPSPTYNVTLIDANRDYGTLTPTELKQNHRSWMIGLAAHGLSAIRDVPNLYEDYVSDIGVQVNRAGIFIGTKKFEQVITDNDEGDAAKNQENYVVDRNFVVAAMARYLNDNYASSSHLETLYDTKILYVDGDNQRLLTRNDDNAERYISYDYLIGCDGIRSTVRAGLAAHHRDFEYSVGDIFTRFKAVHVARPSTIPRDSISLLPDSIPDSLGIALPETGDVINVSIGYQNDKIIPKEMQSDDPAAVADYLKTHFKAFEFVDYDDFARQWVGQNWNTTGMVHCNYYHSSRLNILLMGDAAHATSPSIGMGMNTALADAKALNQLLDRYHDDWDAVLPAYSRERVREGNALTDLAFYLYPIDKTQALTNMVCSLVRTWCHKRCPSLVWEDPQAMIGRLDTKLSEVYDRATVLGIIPSTRRRSDEIRREYFERTTGMVTTKTKGGSWRLMGYTVGIMAVVAAVTVGVSM